MAQPPDNELSLNTPNHPAPTTSTTPASGASTNNTFVMSVSPVGRRKAETYRPQIVTTVGVRPACLVNASVTYVGNNEIYAFGGFDQFTDEVYNHVLRLNLTSRQWNLVDNFGDIPGVRMGHTANLWQGDKLIVYGGENEHRHYLSDVIIFDIKTAHWTSPELNGTSPRGRARHASVIHEDRLYIMGGMTGHENYVLDDICYLDLKTWTWSRIWRFVPRYDHTAWLWANKIWVFGGLGENMERTGDVWWLDPCENPAFHITAPSFGRLENQGNGLGRSRPPFPHMGGSGSSSGHAANSSSIQTNSPLLTNRNLPTAPGSISSLRFRASPSIPTQATGTHFHVFSSGCLLDFATPANITSGHDTGLHALDLQSLRWEKLADGREIFSPDYRWHYCAINDDATSAWLLGCPADTNTRGGEEYLSDVLPLDLTKLGLLGNSLTPEPGNERSLLPASDAVANSPFAGIGADLAGLFDQPPENGSDTDFVITAVKDDEDDVSTMDDESVADYSVESTSNSAESKPIHVHTLILLARWPHFGRLYRSQMREFHTKKMHIPEPYRVVRAFLLYLYTDSIAEKRNNQDDSSGPTLFDIGGMLTMASLYDMPRLRLLCVNRLAREIDIEHAAMVWERASIAGEDWLQKKAANFCMMHWGRLVRTEGFRHLPRRNLMELLEVVDHEGRVVGGEELEAVGGLGASRLGFQDMNSRLTLRKSEEEDDDSDLGMSEDRVSMASDIAERYLMNLTSQHLTAELIDGGVDFARGRVSTFNLSAEEAEQVAAKVKEYLSNSAWCAFTLDMV